MRTNSPSVASYRFPVLLTAWPAQQALLYAALCLTLGLLIFGVGTSLWLWQVKDWGITLSSTGQVVAIQADPIGKINQLALGDTIASTDQYRLERLAGLAQSGDRITVSISHGGQRQAITLVAHPLALADRINASTGTWVGLGFVLLGLAPLLARRRDFRLWMFYLAVELIGLFLITDTPRSYHLVWAEIPATLALPLFPAILFHFHTLFPEPRLGRWRHRAIGVLYLAAALTMLVSIPALWSVAYYYSAGWRTHLNVYLAGVLFLCAGLLARAFITSRDPEVRVQLRIIALGSGIGLVCNAVVVLLPPEWFTVDVNTLLTNLALLSALGTPLAYAYAMIRYDLLIDGVLWRGWLVRVALSSLILLTWLSGILAAFGSDLPTVGIAWWPVVVSTVALTIAVKKIDDWLEDRLFRGRNYVKLLDEVTRELSALHDWDDYGHFFTETLPTRLKLRGAALFITDEKPPTLRLLAASLSGPLTTEAWPLAGSELSARLKEARGPVPLAALRALSPKPYTPADHSMLELLQVMNSELLLPLVSSRQAVLLGVVALGAKATDEPYSGQELSALAALTRAAATAAETVLLFETQQRQLAALQQERAYRAALARDANATQERERRRIARDLHDVSLQEIGVLARALTRLRSELQTLQTRCEERLLDLDAIYAGAAQIPSAEVTEVLDILDRQLGMLLGEDARLINNPLWLENRSPLIRETQPTVEGLFAQAQIVAQHMREICNDLSPTYLDDRLGRTLAGSVARLASQYPTVAIRIGMSGEEPHRLPDDVKIASKQVMDQAIQNALHHANPSCVDVTLCFDREGVIILQVADNGIGFTPRPTQELRARGHHGLANMRERADLVGGNLAVRSRPGQGTWIILTIPLEDPIPGLALPA